MRYIKMFFVNILIYFEVHCSSINPLDLPSCQGTQKVSKQCDSSFIAIVSILGQ